jgi:hypothetical protein
MFFGGRHRKRRTTRRAARCGGTRGGARTGEGVLRVTTHAQARAVGPTAWSKERTDSEGPEPFEANPGQRRCAGHPLGEMARRRNLSYRSMGTWRPTRRSARRSPRRRRKRSKQRAHPGGMPPRQRRRQSHGGMRSGWPPAGDTRLCIAARPLAPPSGSARSRVQLFVARDARSFVGARRTPTTPIQPVSNKRLFRRVNWLLGWACGISPLGAQKIRSRVRLPTRPSWPVDCPVRPYFERRNDAVP